MLMSLFLNITSVGKNSELISVFLLPFRSVQSMLSEVIQMSPLTGKTSNVYLDSSETQCKHFDIIIKPLGVMDQL